MDKQSILLTEKTGQNSVVDNLVNQLYIKIQEYAQEHDLDLNQAARELAESVKTKANYDIIYMR